VVTEAVSVITEQDVGEYEQYVIDRQGLSQRYQTHSKSADEVSPEDERTIVKQKSR
jgi:hypothetical protein